MSDPDRPDEAPDDDPGDAGSEALTPPPPPTWATPGSAPRPSQSSGVPDHPYGPPPGHEPTRRLEDLHGTEPTRRLDVPLGQQGPPPPGDSPAQPGWGQPPPPAPPPFPQYQRYPQDPQYPPGYGPGYGTFGPVTNQKAAWALGSAVVSLVLGCCFPLLGVGGIAGIVLGIQARKEIAASAGHQSGDGLAIAGLVIGIVAIVAAVGFGVLFGIAFLLPS